MPLSTGIYTDDLAALARPDSWDQTMAMGVWRFAEKAKRSRSETIRDTSMIRAVSLESCTTGTLLALMHDFSTFLRLERLRHC